MRNFTKVKFWLLLMVMGLMVSSTMAQTEPKLGVTPDPLNLGEWPIGGWQENAYLELAVDGQGEVTINASELDDVDGVFSLTNPTLPTTISGLDPAVMVGVAFTGEGVTEQTYNATYVASWGTGKSVTTSDITVFGYTPVTGDIVEDPFVVTLPHSDAGVSTAFPMRSNYNIPGTATNGKDVVYMFSLAEDKEVDVTISNATETPKMAIYAAGFEGEGGPMVSNAVATAGAVATDVPLFAGDYYLVVSAETDDAAMTFDIDIDATTMPDPECIVNPDPADGTVEIPSNGIVLSWEYGQYVQEYQVVFGTTYPPTDVYQDWTAAGETGDSYALPNLDPSMQYFWQVNVRNNNATVTCDVYGFTTTLTPPADLTATVVENAEDDYDVQLDWTASAKALLGYNVYRSDDGVTYNMINTDLVETNNYLDEGLAYNMNPCYTYYVEAIFDEGVSEASNEATACITGVGTLDGTVTELLNPGTPIEGATISVVSQTGGSTYEYTADAAGEYSGEVLEDCYTVTVSADGYITEVREDVCVDYDMTTTEDFELDEYPYPVSDVVAYEIDNSTVQVDWGNNGNPGGNDPVEFRYDDGFSTGQLGSSTGTLNTLLGNVHRVDAELTEMSWYLTAEGGPHNTISIWVLGLDADGIPDGNNVLFTESVTNTDETWNTYTFDTPIDATGGFYLAVSYNGFAAIGTDDGVDAPYEFVPNTHYFVGDYTAGGWETWETYDFNVNGMIRAMGVEGGKASYAVANHVSKTNSDMELIENNSSKFTGKPEWKTMTTNSDKELMGYNVYRGSCYSEDDFEFLGYTLDDQFTDNNWGIVDWGVYRWAVEAVYTNNVSERVYSNCLDKDMEAVVNVEVTTNSGDAPEGCMVLFTNTSEPDMELSYELELDATGMDSVDPFRKGIYDILVQLDGYGEIAVSDVLVDSDTTFVWQLEELLAPPSDLYVTPTGFATWTGGGAVPFEPFFENFDTQESFDMWEVVVGGSSSDTWFWNDGTNGQYAETLDGTPYAFVDSDDAGSGTNMDELLISPVIDASNADELYIEFDQFYNNLNSAELADVEVYDGSDWITVLDQSSDAGAWGAPDHVTIDVSAYANADFRVRFHYVAPGWDWHWAVDNVSVTNEAGKYADDKAFQFYKIWHDGVFSNDVDTNFYQYGTNPEVDILVPGETYLAEVASLYSTGLSAKSEYEWTYLPCDSFPGPQYMEAYNVEGSDDVVVLWGTGGTTGTGEFFEDFESGALPTDWAIYDEDGDGYNWEPSLEFNAHSGVGCMYSASYLNSVGPLNPDNYLVSPSITVGATSELSFWYAGQDPAYASEVFYVLVSTTGNAPADFTDEIGGATATGDYQEMVIDLSAYAGQAIHIAIRHTDVTDMFYLNIDDFKVTNTVSKSAFTPSVAAISNEMPFRTTGMSQADIDSKLAAYEANVAKNAKAEPVAIGTNVYRDGEMIAYVPAPDTFLLDMNLAPGYYTYCIATVYTADEGAHTWTSCPDANCMEVLVPEDCLAPTNLTAEDLLGDGHTATLNWQYEITGSGEFMEDFESGAIPTGWEIYDEDGDGYNWEPSLEFVAHSGVGVLYSASYLNGIGALNPDNYLVSPAIEVSSSSELSFWYVGQDPAYASEVFYVKISTTGNTPADFTETIGNGTATGTYQEMVIDLSDYAGESVYIAIEHTDVTDMFYLNIDDFKVTNTVSKAAYTPNATPASTIPFKTEGMSQAEIDAAMAEYQANYVEGAKVLEGTNVYRDGEFVAFVEAPATTYADLLDEAGYHCYEVTGVYSVCGESDPSNEACVDVSVGINSVENNVSVYPNPAKDFVMVDASQNIRSIKVTNYMGQVVNAVKSVETTQYRINTSDLSSGVYFVEVETTAGIEKVRIVISE